MKHVIDTQNYPNYKNIIVSYIATNSKNYWPHNVAAVYSLVICDIVHVIEHHLTFTEHNIMHVVYMYYTIIVCLQLSADHSSDW